MKRRNAVVLLSAILLLLAFAGQAFSSMYGTFSGFPIVKIMVNGQEVRGDVPGVILSGRTMVPVRFVSEALGADVTWDQDTLTVGITSKGSAAKPNSSPSSSQYGSYAGFPIVRIVVNGQEVRGDVPGVIVSGRTMVPVRFVSEALGADVTWEQATMAVGITSKDHAVGSINHVILSPVHVTRDWILFTDMQGGWPLAIVNKESHGVKFYEAAIWDDVLSIHLYAFPNDFDASYGDMENLPMQERVAYRESFCVMEMSGMPADISKRGPFVLNAFKEITKLLVERHPEATHHLTFLGHGGPGGELFATHLSRREASEYLSHWSSTLGRKLGVIDMGMPCSKGSFQDLEIFHEHAEYYIASELDICGAVADDEEKDFNITDWLYNYPRLLSSHATLEDALIARVDLHRQMLEDGRIARTADKNMQSLYLYSCKEFGLNKDAISAFMKAQDFEGLDTVFDIKKFMQENGAGPDLLGALSKIIVHGIDNRDFFTWPKDWNGMSWCNFEYDH